MSIVTLNAGSGGAEVRTSLVNTTENIQHVRVTFGAVDTEEIVTTANPLPVDIRDLNATLTVDLGANNDVTVQGEGAENAAVSGNPVLAGGRYDATPRTLDDGDVGALALDPDGALHIADGGNSITVDGTVDLGATDNAVLDAIAASLAGALNVSGATVTVAGTVDLGATDNAVLDAIAASLAGSLDVSAATVTVDSELTTADLDTGAGTDTRAVVGVVLAESGGGALVGSANPMPVSIGATVTVDNGGTFATQVDGDALTALQLIDNPVLVDDAEFTLTTSSVMMAGAVRDDALSTLDAAEGDAVPLRVSSTGALHVTGGGGGTEYTDDTSTHATGSSAGGLMMAAATPSDGTVDANDIGAVAMSLDRRLHVDAQIVGQDAAVSTTWNGTAPPIGAGTEATALRVTVATDSTGVLSIDDNGASLTVDGTVAISALTPGNAAGNLGKAEDAAHASGDTGVMVLGRRIDTLASSAGTSGDYATFNLNALGALYVRDMPSTTGGLSIFRSLDIDETEEAVKATAGTLYWVHALNLAAGVRYLKFYNATVATVVVGTTTPVLTLPIPTQGDTNGAGFTFNIDKGLAFGTAITVACVTGVADNDTTGAGTNEVVINVGYL